MLFNVIEKSKVCLAIFLDKLQFVNSVNKFNYSIL